VRHFARCSEALAGQQLSLAPALGFRVRLCCEPGLNLRRQDQTRRNRIDANSACRILDPERAREADATG
jgi:hypothetical protein